MSLPGDTLDTYPFLISTHAHIRHKLLCAAADMGGALGRCPVPPHTQGAEAQSARGAEVLPRPPSPEPATPAREGSADRMGAPEGWALPGSPGRGAARGPDAAFLRAPGSSCQLWPHWAALGRTHPLQAFPSPEEGGEQRLRSLAGLQPWWWPVTSSRGCSRSAWHEVCPLSSSGC